MKTFDVRILAIHYQWMANITEFVNIHKIQKSAV